jgi:alpha-ribazole phosphatase
LKNYNIYLLRHGETEANEKGLYIGKTDMPLSLKGVETLTLMRDSFLYPRVGKVYTSPLSRAAESATLLFPDYPREQITAIDELREMDFGVFEGLPALELTELDSYKKWLSGGLDNPPPAGESTREVLSRCYTAMEMIIADMMASDITESAVITHAGIITNIICGFGLPKYNPRDITMGFGTGFMISVSAQLWQTSGAFEVVSRIPLENI